MRVCPQLDRALGLFPQLAKDYSDGTLHGMNAVTLEYPEAWLAPLGTDAEQFAKEAKLAAAMKLFETGRFTSGQAARLAGMERVDFLLSCRQWGVDSVKWDEAELEAEFATPMPRRA